MTNIKYSKVSLNLNDLVRVSMQQKVEAIVPNFKKNIVTDDQILQIVNAISSTLNVSQDRAFIGMILLFLQGAVSSSAPLTMSVEVDEGKCIEKKNILSACKLITGHQYIRRIAEALAAEIGEFAYRNNLRGELANRINNRLRADTGSNLTDVEMSYCSSFSQNITHLSEITGSDRLSKLLAQDYQRRFEHKRASLIKEDKSVLRRNKRKK